MHRRRDLHPAYLYPGKLRYSTNASRFQDLDCAWPIGTKPVLLVWRNLWTCQVDNGCFQTFNGTLVPSSCGRVHILPAHSELECPGTPRYLSPLLLNNIVKFLARCGIGLLLTCCEPETAATCLRTHLTPRMQDPSTRNCTSSDSCASPMTEYRQQDVGQETPMLRILTQACDHTYLCLHTHDEEHRKSPSVRPRVIKSATSDFLFETSRT